MKRKSVFTALAWAFGALGAIALLGADAWAADPVYDYRGVGTTADLSTDTNASITTNGVLTIGNLTGTSGAFDGWDLGGTEAERPGGGFLYISSSNTTGS